MSKEILSSLFRDVAIVDGVMRTMMIARQTASASPVVQPFRISIVHPYVAHRTDLLTQSAPHTALLVNSEFSVAYHPCVEISSYHVS